MIQRFNLDINPNLWLSRLQSVELERAGVGASHPYRTPRDLHTRAEFRELANAIRSALPEDCEFLSLWANLMTRGNRVGMHDHTRRDEKCTLAGCLFLTEGSDLVFPLENPPVYIAPLPGLLVVFPADAKHSVEPCRSTERWSIAFNANRRTGETLNPLRPASTPQTSSIGIGVQNLS